MNRRDAVRTTLTTLSVVSLGAAISSSFGGTALAAPGVLKDVADTAALCLKAGMACAAHCEEQLKKGNKEMANCHTAVTDMMAACEAMQKLAARGSKHAPAFAKATAAACADCIKACEVHAKHMPECADCVAACKECEKACLKAA